MACGAKDTELSFWAKAKLSSVTHHHFNHCIFCLSATNQLTAEHIVPEFVGGALKVPFVCKRCNEKIGGDFEGSTSRNLLFSFPCYLYGIQGKADKPVNPFPGVGETAEGLKVSLDENFEPHIKTQVSDSLSPDGTYTVSMTVDAADKDKIPEIVKKKALRYLKSTRPDMPEEEVDAYIAHTLSTIPSDPLVRRSRPALQYQMTLDMDALRFLFLKIAYEAAAYHHGPAYLADPTAKELRDTIYKRIYKEEKKSELRIKGQVPLLKDDIEPLATREECHTLLLLNNACYIRLFNTSGIVSVTEEGGRFALPHNAWQIHFFDYTSLTHTSLLYSDYLEKDDIIS